MVLTHPANMHVELKMVNYIEGYEKLQQEQYASLTLHLFKRTNKKKKSFLSVIKITSLRE